MKLANIHTELKRLRKEDHQMTLVRVAAETGLSVSFISGIERGKSKPSIATIEKLAACYGVVCNVRFEVMKNIIGKSYGHDIQCMTPLGVDNERWGCTRCGIEADDESPTTRLQVIVWGIRKFIRNAKEGNIILFSKIIINEEDDIPF